MVASRKDLPEAPLAHVSHIGANLVMCPIKGKDQGAAFSLEHQPVIERIAAFDVVTHDSQSDPAVQVGPPV
jgi:hypothetical protein